MQLYQKSHREQEQTLLEMGERLSEKALKVRQDRAGVALLELEEDLIRSASLSSFSTSFPPSLSPFYYFYSLFSMLSFFPFSFLFPFLMPLSCFCRFFCRVLPAYLMLSCSSFLGLPSILLALH